MNGNTRGARATPRGGYSTHNGSSLGSPPGSNGGDSEHYYNNYPVMNHLYGSGSTHHSRSSRGVPRGRGRGVAVRYNRYTSSSDGPPNGVNGVYSSRGSHNSYGSHGSLNGVSSVNGVNGVNGINGINRPNSPNNPNNPNGGRTRGTASEGATRTGTPETRTAIGPPSYSILTQRAMAAAAARRYTGRGGPGPGHNVAPPVVSVGLPDSNWANGNSAMTTGVDPSSSSSSSSRLSLNLSSDGGAGVVIGGGGGSGGGASAGESAGWGGRAGAGQVTRTETERGPERGG